MSSQKWNDHLSMVCVIKYSPSNLFILYLIDLLFYTLCMCMCNVYYIENKFNRCASNEFLNCSSFMCIFIAFFSIINMLLRPIKKPPIQVITLHFSFHSINVMITLMSIFVSYKIVHLLLITQ